MSVTWMTTDAGPNVWTADNTDHGRTRLAAAHLRAQRYAAMPRWRRRVVSATTGLDVDLWVQTYLDVYVQVPSPDGAIVRGHLPR